MATTSGIKTVQAVINGQTYNLTYNSQTQKYEATVTAPNTSSFNNNEGHYYPVSITATDQADNAITVDDTHATLGASLRLKVKEKVAPTVSAITPTNGSYLSTSAPEITAQLRDNDSGVAIDTLILKIDNTAVDNAKVTKDSVSGGYNISYTPTTALGDGSHTVSVQVADNDGNMSTAVSTTFTVMTTAPVLTITSPADDLKTKNSALTVSGTTGTDASITIKLNGADQGSVTVNTSTGAFSKPITLSTEGENIIEITASNLAGVTTVVEKTVIFDTTAPIISGITITPNPVDSGATYVISVEVTD